MCCTAGQAPPVQQASPRRDASEGAGVPNEARAGCIAGALCRVWAAAPTQYACKGRRWKLSYSDATGAEGAGARGAQGGGTCTVHGCMVCAQARLARAHEILIST